MKKIFFTLCALFSLFSYSSDPLSLDVLDGKSFVCSNEVGLTDNLDPLTYDANKISSYNITGFTFNGAAVKAHYIEVIKSEESDGIYYPFESVLRSSQGFVDRVLPRYIRWKITNYGWQYFAIDRQTLTLYKVGYDTLLTELSLLHQDFQELSMNCVLAKNKESYDKYMENIQIKNQEKIDKERLDRKRKLIEQTKNNQI